jgi:HEPN domain-containing protein/predicted nucleotidyltransferase
MLTSLEQVVQRIVEGYDPDTVILFGSHARGEALADSDVDLLIVKATDQRPIERRVQVERLLADRRLPLDILVYTPEEFRALFAVGSPFIEEVVETGRVLFMRKATAAWLAEAQEELEVARILLDHGKHRGACLHSQQCVEKALKALILERGKRPPRTHDIVELLNQVAAEGYAVGLSMEDAIFLGSVYRGRYPTEEGLLPHGEPTREDAGRSVVAADGALQSARRILGA